MYYNSVEMALKWLSNNILQVSYFVLHMMTKYLAYCGTLLDVPVPRTLGGRPFHHMLWTRLVWDRQCQSGRISFSHTFVHEATYKVWGYYLAPIEFGAII